MEWGGAGPDGGDVAMGEVAEARLPDPGETVSHGAWGGDFILKACG